MTNGRKWVILVITSVSTFMSTLDSSIVNVALPIMSDQLGVSINSIQWVVTSYLITISVLLLIWGKLADIYGKKYIFSGGFVIFAIGSFFCSISHTLVMLVAMRIVQAMGASAMMSLSQGIITTVFPPQERGRAMGFVGTTVALGSLTGPSLGGILVHLFGWPSIFLINVPIGLAGAALSFIIIPDIFPRQEDKSFDWKGSLLFTGFILILFLGLLLVQQGTLPPIYLIPAVLASAALLALLIVFERRRSNPLLNLQLFSGKVFPRSLASAFLSFVAINSTLLFIPFYLQDLKGLSAWEAGLIISANPIAIAFTAPISGWLSDKIGSRPLTITGMSVSALSLVLLATLSSDTQVWVVMIYLFLFGMGNAIFQSPNTSVFMSSVHPAQLGVAGGFSALARNLGMAMGTTSSVLIFSFVTQLSISSVSSGNFESGTFLKGMIIIFIFDALCCISAAVISATIKIKEQHKSGGSRRDLKKPDFTHYNSL